MTNFRKVVQVSIAFGVAILFISLVANRNVISFSKPYLHNSVNSIKINKVGLVLGTSKYAYGGGINPYFKYRMEAAAELFHAGKVAHLVVSGDNHKHGYNVL